MCVPCEISLYTCIDPEPPDMTPEEYILLYEKHAAGQCTPEEAERLKNYQDGFQLVDLPWRSEAGDKEEIRKQLLSRLHADIAPRKPGMFWLRYRKYAAAAVVLLVTASSIIFFRSKQQSPADTAATTQVLAKLDKVVPGSNRATLLVDGEPAIALDAVHAGILVKQGDATIAKQQNGELRYATTNGAPLLPNSAAPATYNRVSTPRGGQYRLTLSDGTKVWLNAASSLRFPIAFTGNARTVELTGEAYFEVARDERRPFRVKTSQMAVDVLGTHFNVSAYPDDVATTTTLLEGAVRLTSPKEDIRLKPGQAAVHMDKGFRLHPANGSDAIAWKEGYFVFDNENIQSIMKKIARWYDVSVVYEGNVDVKDFGGTVSRYSSVASVLKALQLTGTVRFRQEGRRIVVMP